MNATADDIEQRIDWDEVTRFTPNIYRAYQAAPQWEIDSPTFRNKRDYVSYWCKTVSDFVLASKNVIGDWQKQGRQCAKALETTSQGGGAMPIWDMGSAVAREPLPIAISMVHEKVALLSANPPKPEISPKQESQQQYCSGLQQLVDMTMEANSYETEVSAAYYDIQFWRTAIFKWGIDIFSPGLLGESGKIELQKISPDEIFFDPRAKKLDCRNMDYIVQRHELEIGEIQQAFPLTAKYVNVMDESRLSEAALTSRDSGVIATPVAKLGRDTPGKAQKIVVYECWLRDTRTRFMPSIKDSKKEEFSERFKTDKDGCIIGDFVPRYPDGRVIVCTQTAVLLDSANPYPHGQFPYVFATGMPSSVPWAAGNAPRIMTVTRKINNIVGDMHEYYQSEIKRPMHSSPGAILDPNMAQDIPNKPSAVVELSGPQAVLMRPQAQDIPPLSIQFLSFLQSMVDMASGSSGIMRGQLEESAQISAEMMASLQQFASSRLALEVRFFNTAMKQLFYQLVWILRGTIDSSIKMDIMLPNGEKKTIDWKSDREVFKRGDPIEIRKLRASEDYLIGIKAGTGSPGAQAQQHAQAQQLYNDGAIDRRAYLDMIQLGDRQNIVPRMEAHELEEIKAKAIGKEIGVALADILKKDDPGRREKL